MRCPACRSQPSGNGQSALHKVTVGSVAGKKQFNERSGGVLNRTQYPSDVIALVVLWRLRYKLSLRDLTEMFQVRGFVFSYDAVRDREAKLTPAFAQELRRGRKGKVGHSWYVDETYIQVRGGWNTYTELSIAMVSLLT